MSCNGLEWIQPPSNESRLPGCYAYYDPPARIVDELNRLVDRNKRLEEELERTKQDRNAIAKNTREPLLLKLDHANERIKRLEEALERLFNLPNDCCCELSNSSLDAWKNAHESLKAKEAKP
jgi:uncharacterized protein (UPF0335 family)